MGLLAAGSVVGAAVANGYGRGGSRAGAATVAPKRRDGVVALGQAYLRDHPKESDADFLVRRLPGIDPERGVRRQMRSLAPAIKDDFLSGRVVFVQGWQLSRTEARAAAAVALGL